MAAKNAITIYVYNDSDVLIKLAPMRFFGSVLAVIMIEDVSKQVVDLIKIVFVVQFG